MIDRFDRQDSVVNRIIDGSITIDSIEEFENLLQAFPNDPRLHRIFADRLLKEKSFHAAEQFRRSARLFLESGMPLQAIASKIFEWQILKPSHEESLAFHSALLESNPRDTEVQKFFTKLTYDEMIALMAKIVPDAIPPGTWMVKFGDVENELCFIVSGLAEETAYHRPKNTEKVKKESEMILTEGDIFGEIYPFEGEQLSPSDIKSVTFVEVLKISKLNLIGICNEFPNLKLMIRNLYRHHTESRTQRPSKTVRKAARHQIPMQVNLKIFKDETGKPPINLGGFTDNISLAGACIVLGVKYQTGNLSGLIGKNVKIQMSLPIESISLNILGTIVWSKEVTVEKKKTAIVGVQFKDMIDIDREILKDYCCGSEAEQNLIWSLWSSLMEK
ncbi:MAG: PilZ domain-containing protein [Desulfobacterales bacterium]